MRVKLVLVHPIPTPSSFPTDPYKVVSLLESLFACASVVSCIAFVLSLFVPHLSLM